MILPSDPGWSKGRAKLGHLLMLTRNSATSEPQLPPSKDFLQTMYALTHFFRLTLKVFHHKVRKIQWM